MFPSNRNKGAGEIKAGRLQRKVDRAAITQPFLKWSYLVQVITLLLGL
jgi:hypothetical protein